MAKLASPTQRLEQLRLSSAQARLPFEKDWWLNVAFFLDEQYVEWVPDLNNLRRIPRTDKTKHMPRPVVNKINHFVLQQHAFALQNKPTPDVLPAGDSAIDMSEAAVSLAYCNYAAGPLVADYDHQQSQAVLWALVAGEAFFKWCWDPVRNRPLIMYCSPFDMYTDPYADDFTKNRYIIHSKFMDKEQVFNAYGVEVTAKAEQQDQVRAKLLREMGNAPVLEGVTVNEIWMKPNRRMPGGMFCVWTGDQLLVQPDKIPYVELRKDYQLPFTQIGVVPRPGSQHYDSNVKYLRKPQMELNKYHAQRIQIRENFANPKWWVPDELELEETPDNSAGQVLRGHSDSGLSPQIIQAAAMADNNEGEWIGQEMMDTVGLHEVSQGQVPGRVESSKAIELLKEADATRLAELTRTLTASMARGWWQLLMLGKQYESEERVVQTYSPDGIPEVREWKASKVSPGTRFNVTMGTGLAWSRAARTDQILRLVEVGVVGPAAGGNPEDVLALLDIPSPLALSARASNIRLARNENIDLAKGTPIKPNSWDDHEVHLKEHNAYRQGHEYLLISTDAKQKFEMHCDTHETLQVASLEKKARLALVAQGATLQQPQDPGQAGQQGGAPPEPGEEADTAGQTAPDAAPDATAAAPPPGPQG